MQVFSYDDVATSLAVLLGVVPKLLIDEKAAAKVRSPTRILFMSGYD